jgi:Fe-S cluster assembly protein SufD
MTVTPIKTKAEQQLAAQFEAAAATLPGAGWVPAARRAAMHRFAAAGLPHRKLEAWKYTDLRATLKDVPAPAPSTAGKPKLDAAKLKAALGPDLAKLPAIRFVFVNGAFAAADIPDAHKPGTSYQFGTLAETLGTKDFEWMEAGFATEASSPAALNAAFATDGIVLRVPANAKLELPIHLVFLTDSASPSRVTTRNLIRVDNGAEITLLESHVGAGGAHHVNSLTHLHVLDGAKVDHLRLAADGPQATHLCTWIVDVEAGATYSAFQLSESPLLARNDVNVTFAGENASFKFNAASLGRGKSHIDTTMVIDHAVPRCTSRENIRAVLADEARGIFQGKVIVRPDAQKSDGKQMAKALLLSPDAEFDSKPELEIYADDVVCGHGSTVAEMDEDHVFYLMARGIPETQARALLTEAFAAEVIDAIAHEGIREAMRARLAAWLAAE